MSRVIEAVRTNTMGTLKAVRTFGVPRITLQRLSKNDLEPRETAKTKLCRKTVLDLEIEKEFVGNGNSIL